jgi:anti-sigma-K factor RskA
VNIQEYISSGILEAYVLGELPEQERASVEKNLAEYPELRKELARIEGAQENLLLQAAIEPRAEIKEKLFKKIESSKPSARVVNMDSGLRPGLWKFAAAASISIALVASYLAYDYHNKWKTSESDLATLIAQHERIAQHYNQVNERLNKMESDLKIIDDPDFNRVVMKGTPNSPQSLASVYWNQNSKEVYLSIQNMKELARENQYQLWAIIDGKPVDAGVFDGNVTGLLKMKNIGVGVATFAVTIETRGGKPSPNLETIQVAGNVDKG